MEARLRGRTDRYPWYWRRIWDDTNAPGEWRTRWSQTFVLAADRTLPPRQARRAYVIVARDPFGTVFEIRAASLIAATQVQQRLESAEASTRPGIRSHAAQTLILIFLAGFALMGPALLVGVLRSRVDDAVVAAPADSHGQCELVIDVTNTLQAPCRPLSYRAPMTIRLLRWP